MRGEGQRGHTWASRNTALLEGLYSIPTASGLHSEDSLTHLLSHLLCLTVTCLHFLVEILQQS